MSGGIFEEILAETLKGIVSRIFARFTHEPLKVKLLGKFREKIDGRIHFLRKYFEAINGGFSGGILGEKSFKEETFYMSAFTNIR